MHGLMRPWHKPKSGTLWKAILRSLFEEATFPNTRW